MYSASGDCAIPALLQAEATFFANILAASLTPTDVTVCVMDNEKLLVFAVCR